jgi:hypothetical protein
MKIKIKTQTFNKIIKTHPSHKNSTVKVKKESRYLKWDKAENLISVNYINLKKWSLVKIWCK